jgi:hypothetical protein
MNQAPPPAPQSPRASWNPPLANMRFTPLPAYLSSKLHMPQSRGCQVWNSTPVLAQALTARSCTSCAERATPEGSE